MGKVPGAVEVVNDIGGVSRWQVGSVSLALFGRDFPGFEAFGQSPSLIANGQNSTPNRYATIRSNARRNPRLSGGDPGDPPSVVAIILSENAVGSMLSIRHRTDGTSSVITPTAR